jgi:hypothetical protein
MEGSCSTGQSQQQAVVPVEEEEEEEHISNCITNAATCFGASKSSSGSLYIVFGKVEAESTPGTQCSGKDYANEKFQ